MVKINGENIDASGLTISAYLDITSIISSLIISKNFGENSDDAYWKNVLKYSKQGNFQAVFDEYVHFT